MRFIDAEQVHTLGDFPSLIAALDGFHGEAPQAMEDLMLTQPLDGADANHLLIRAAWQFDQMLGIKIASVFPDNPNQAPGVPAVQAMMALFDGKYGTPIAVIDGTALTYRKTAADSALGCQYLCVSAPKTLLMVGAGGLAPYLIEAHRCARPSIESVMVWNRTKERASALVRSLSEGGVSASVVDDLESAAGRCDLICCATSTPEPLLRGEWLKAGTHVDLVGAYTAELREADDEVLRRSSIFVDARATTVRVLGELTIPIANGVIRESDVLADLFDLAQGRHAGRCNAREITVYKNGGGAHLDLMTARFLLQKAAD